MQEASKMTKKDFLFLPKLEFGMDATGNIINKDITFHSFIIINRTQKESANNITPFRYIDVAVQSDRLYLVDGCCDIVDIDFPVRIESLYKSGLFRFFSEDRLMITYCGSDLKIKKARGE